MEKRIALTNQEAFELSKTLKIISTSFLTDIYTGEKRIRTQESGEVEEKEYKTPVVGTIYRFSSLCEFKDFKKVWFEFKWTEKVQRFEIEFEDGVPEEFENRENIAGWEILKLN